MWFDPSSADVWQSRCAKGCRLKPGFPPALSNGNSAFPNAPGEPCTQFLLILEN